MHSWDFCYAKSNVVSELDLCNSTIGELVSVVIADENAEAWKHSGSVVNLFKLPHYVLVRFPGVTDLNLEGLDNLVPVVKVPIFPKSTECMNIKIPSQERGSTSVLLENNYHLW